MEIPQWSGIEAMENFATASLATAGADSTGSCLVLCFLFFFLLFPVPLTIPSVSNKSQTRGLRGLPGWSEWTILSEGSMAPTDPQTREPLSKREPPPVIRGRSPILRASLGWRGWCGCGLSISGMATRSRGLLSLSLWLQLLVCASVRLWNESSETRRAHRHG